MIERLATCIYRVCFKHIENIKQNVRKLLILSSSVLYLFLKIVLGHFHCNPGISSTHKLYFIIIICTTHKVSSTRHTTQHNSPGIIFIIEQINLLHLLTIMILSTLLAIIKVTEINLEMHSLHSTEAPHNIVYWQAQISS